jgi:3-phosphoglycerate kinase
MTIYIPLLYICFGLKCVFLQSESFTIDEQKCEQEIAQKKDEFFTAGATVQAICVDINVKNEREKDEQRTIIKRIKYVFSKSGRMG